MKTASLIALLCLIVLLWQVSLFAQTLPDIENGFKAYGSYDGSNLDTVNLMNGNLILHIPMPFSYPQRGKISPTNLLTVTSKAWHVQCDTFTNSGAYCFWTIGRTQDAFLADMSLGLGFALSADMSVHRYWQAVSTTSVAYTSFGYYLTTADGATHQLTASPNAPLDANSDPMAFDSIDTTGFHLDLTNPDISTGIPAAGLLTDRSGNQYKINKWVGSCKSSTNNQLAFATITTTCTQASQLTTITDSNGNVYAINRDTGLPVDTMGRQFLSYVPANSSLPPVSPVCNTGGLTLTGIAYESYAGPNGGINQFQVCSAGLTIQTAFGVPNVVEAQNERGVTPPLTTIVPVDIVMPDGSSWTFQYDSYGNVTYVGLPTGGSISYTWKNVTMCPVAGTNSISRAVTSRTVNDGNGHSFVWNYNWGTPSNGILLNSVTDGNGNDSEHQFTGLGGANSCNFYETTTRLYQGSGASRQLLQQVDTAYTSSFMSDQSPGGGDLGNIFATDVTTTIFPSNKVKRVHRDPDPGLGLEFPIFGQTVKELEYDWGPAAPGPLLRETDTTFQWQIDSRFLAAHLLDLPASVVVKDGAGNKVSETDYLYDEPNYFQPYTGALPTGTHVSQPAAVRGNLTTTSHWLNTNNSSVVSHTRWLDTGEIYQSIDPLGHTTTHAYDPAYAGAFSTQTCNAKGQCANGTYDFQTGALSTFTDANGAAGDPAHTSNYGYDLLGRFASALQPPDPSGVRPQSTFAYSPGGAFPETRTRQKAITAALTDSATSFFDGLGRPYRSQHATPNGNSTIDLAFDALDHTTTATNPYFAATDPTYGTVSSQYDGLGRVVTSTKQDGSISSVDYSAGNCITSTDEAGHVRKNCSDALGRLIEVDEPNAGVSGVAAHGSISISQLSRTPVTVGAVPANTASGSLTIAGVEKSTLVTTKAATSATVTITVGGQNGTNTTVTSICNPNTGACTQKTSLSADAGTMQVSVNAGGTVVTSSPVSYSSTQTPAGLAQALAAAFPANSAVQASFAGGSSFVLRTLATGVGANSTTFSTVIATTNCVNSITDSSTTTCSQGWWMSPAFGSFSGGANAVTATRFDAGSVNLTVNGHQNSASFGQGDTAVSVANRLIGAVNLDGAAYVSASLVSSPPDQSSASITLVARTAGAGGNYPSSTTNSFDTTDFSSSSFTTSTQASLINGANANSGTTYYDSGTVTLSIGAFTATAPYGPSTNNTAATVAAALVSAGANGLNRPGSPVSATASGAGITLSYLTQGTAGNVTASVSSSVDPSVAAYFSGSTYSGSSSLSGGINPIPADLSNPYVTLYQYDALGNLLCVEQHGNVAGTGCSAPPTSDATSPWRVRRFTYDSLSRLLTAHNPESGTITYSYDADGNLLQKTSPAPNQTGAATQTISYCYDELHRVTAKDYQPHTYTPPNCPITSPVVTYTYDGGANAIGHLTHLSDQAGTADYTYDPLGRIATESRAIAGVTKAMSYDYNLDGSIKTIHYPSGAAVTYTPDSAGRMLKAIDTANNINYITGATYQADGQLTGFISGNATAFAGITNTFSFNKRLQPINMSASAPSQTVFSIGYDFHVGNGTTGSDNGNVWAITNYKDNSRNQSFTYDSLNRLTSAQNAGTDCTRKTLSPLQTEYWGNSYTYDAWGNLTNKTVTKCGAENLSAPSLVNNQLSGYGYDAAGNMTSDPTDGGLALTYDQENRISGTGGYTYTYDADGNRVKKTNGSTGTLYWYMTPGIVAESDLSGTLKSEYVFFDGERVARRDLPAGAVSYYFSDHLKTASVITDSLGNIKSESDYYPWGGELQFVANDSNHYKFTGKERDETGLDYFGARYYSNGLARFITPDWDGNAAAVPYAEFADPQSLNLYTYVRNVPTVKVDADGHDVLGDAFVVAVSVMASKMGPVVDTVADVAHFAFTQWQPHGVGPLPASGCTCPTTTNQQTNTKQNNNNSQSSNTAEQGRDAQGRFTSKQPGQSAPGAAAEKEALDAVGATKNTEAIPGSNRIPDGKIENAAGAVEQYVEGKSGASVNNTAQLRQMAKAAVDATGKPLKLVTTNPNVKIAKTVLRNKNIEIVKLKQK